jgi:ankyrin repeat protein
VNQASRDGCSPLFIAAQQGFIKVVRCLVLELGADVNQAKDDGGTPLMIAAMQGHLNVVQLRATLHTQRLAPHMTPPHNI